MNQSLIIVPVSHNELRSDCGALVILLAKSRNTLDLHLIQQLTLFLPLSRVFLVNK